jgi:hypothetical protein
MYDPDAPYDFETHAEFTATCGRAIEKAKAMAKAANEPYTVYRSLVDSRFAVAPSTEPVPAGWNTVAEYDTDGTEYKS